MDDLLVCSSYGNDKSPPTATSKYDADVNSGSLIKINDTAKQKRTHKRSTDK